MYTFKTIATDYKQYNGMKGKIIRELDDSERDPEVGNMYKFKLENGKIISVFEDEIKEV